MVSRKMLCGMPGESTCPASSSVRRTSRTMVVDEMTADVKVEGVVDEAETQTRSLFLHLQLKP